MHPGEQATDDTKRFTLIHAGLPEGHDHDIQPSGLTGGLSAEFF
jgi:hypothetical protein